MFTTTLLFHPLPDAPLSIMTDASNIAIGAVVQQLVDNHWQPVSYFSTKLSSAESRYSTFDRELLAIYTSIRHFKHYVEGRKFHILTDHKPLVYSLFSNSTRYSPRQARHLDYISQFTSDIHHVTGSNNPVTDALSHLDINAIHHLPQGVDFVAMAAAQQTDPELQKLRISDSCPLKFAEIPLEGTEVKLLCDISTGHQSPYVPQKFRHEVFTLLHSLAHPGIRATQHLLTNNYVWPQINKDVRDWTRKCLQCQKKNKVN